MKDESAREHLFVFSLGAVFCELLPESPIGKWSVLRDWPGDQDSWE